MENKILGKEIPVLTIKESRAIANIVRNETKEVSLASRMGASSKLHSTVEILSDDIAVIDSSIKEDIKEEVVYTTIFDHGVEDKDKVVYTTEDGEIALVKKSSSTYTFTFKRFNSQCRMWLAVLLKKYPEDINSKFLLESLNYCDVSFTINKDKFIKDYASGTLPEILKEFIKAVPETAPMFDVLYSMKEDK